MAGVPRTFSTFHSKNHTSLMKTVLTKNEVAKFFRVHPNTVSGWAKKRPQLFRCPYNLDSIARWRQQAEQEDSNNELAQQKLEADLALKKAVLRLKTFEADLKSGRLISAADRQQSINHMKASITETLKQVPSKYANTMLQLQSIPEAKQALEPMIDDILKKLHG